MIAQAAPDPSLSKLSRDDAERIAALFLRCSDYFLLQDGELPTLVDAHKLFTDLPSGKSIDDLSAFGLVAGDGLCAVTSVLRNYPQEGIWYIGLVVVDAARRYRGIGRSFYGAIEAWATGRGAREFRLAVLEGNQEGLRFWQSMGFQEMRRVGPHSFKSRSHHRIEMIRVFKGNRNGSAA